ncbi:MAG: hypothetical protein PHY44_03520 [Lachnospiraceae bacterium]|nr:hypothetical protein [Lachnospiraceae bacterium]
MKEDLKETTENVVKNEDEDGYDGKCYNETRVYAFMTHWVIL